MARPRTGTAYTKGGRIYLAVRLRSGHRWARPWLEGDAGNPVDVVRARGAAAELQRQYDCGAWDPEASTLAAVSDAPAQPTVLDVLRAWVKTLPTARAIDDGNRVEAYVPHAPLGAVIASAVTPDDVSAFVVWLAARPSHRGGTLAPRTIRNAYEVVRQGMTWATKCKRIPTNPCATAPDNLPAIDYKHREFRALAVFTRTEAEALCFDERVPTDRRVVYAVLFLTGVRFGELAALRVRHWTEALEPLGRMLVANSIERATRTEKSTKTGIVREVPVHPTLAAILTEWLATGWREMLGRDPGADDLLIPSREGRPRSVRHAHRKLQDDLTRLGLRARRVHDTRRTFVSLCRDDGARGEILRHVTHGPRKSDMMDVYGTQTWATYCTEVLKLRLGSQAVPLGSATGLATSEAKHQENGAKRGGVDGTRSPGLRLDVSPSARKHVDATGSGVQFEPPNSTSRQGLATTVANGDVPAWLTAARDAHRAELDADAALEALMLDAPAWGDA
jgi:integrase